MVTRRCNAYGGWLHQWLGSDRATKGDDTTVWCDLEDAHDGMHEAVFKVGKIGWGWPKGCKPSAFVGTEKLRRDPLWCVESLWRTFWRLGGWT